MTKVTHLTVEEGGAQNRRRIHLREISGDSDAPLETVGQDLRAARLRRGDDLATVSKALKIRKDHLEALEEDRIESLPGRTYAVGFVRTYADFLGLDAAQSVERFKAQIAGRADEPQPTITVIDEDEHRRLPQGWKIIAGVVLLLFAYGAYYLLVPAADKMLTPPVAPVPQQQVAAKPKPRVAPPPAPVATAPTTIAPVTTPAITPPGTAPAATDTANAAPVPAGKVYGQNNRNARVVLRMKQTTRVLVQSADGMTFINRTLNAGDSYMVPDQVGLTLTAANAGAIEVDLDGAPMGTAGRVGQIAETLSLDPQAIADRANRR
ncbi:MAG: helix-turn-helix domain-containing protein [Alphaproteobacteria bacterium]|nr:helix-turn-helix domain-containing protein [Alphaproteobacteria bacterium]